MDRRNFLRSMIGGVVATAAVRTWPFRVYSFPSEITYPPQIPYFIDYYLTSNSAWFLSKDIWVLNADQNAIWKKLSYGG